jgi:CheY-like chemotaxis protein
MGAEITVRSEAGKGSTFRVKLHLPEVSRPRIASTMEDRVRGYAGPRQTILVVDDNEEQRDLVHELLTPLGFNMLTAASGRECLQLAERHKPNLILLDIAMPEMDGWQVAQRFRRQSRERTAILMLSANAMDPHHKLEAERLYDDALMKPIDLRQLLKKIHALLNIEWIHESEPAAPLPEALLASTASSVAPGGGDIDELISLGQIGHVRGILDKLGEIEARLPDCRDFVARMRAMVGTFELKRYAAALEKIRDGHA